MTELIIKVLDVMAPVILAAIARQQTALGRLPTKEELTADLHANVSQYISEGQAWRSDNPDPS